MTWPSRTLSAIAAGAVGGLLIVAHAATWFIVTGRIGDGLSQFVTAAAAEGWEVQTGARQRAGWPWAAAMQVRDVVATRPLGETALRWTVERLDLTVSPAASRHLRIEAFGPQTVKFGNEQPVPVLAEKAVLLVPLDGGPLEARVDGASATFEGGRQIRATLATARIDAGAVATHVAGLALTPPLPPPFDAGASLSARVLTQPSFPAASTPGRSASAWQAAGGRIELPEFALDWGALRAEGMGAGGLDPLLQPWARVTLRMQGAPLVLDAAVRAGWVQAGPASAARAVLGLLALSTGGGPVVLPIVVQDRTLTVAQFPLIRLPILDWGAP